MKANDGMIAVRRCFRRAIVVEERVVYLFTRNGKALFSAITTSNKAGSCDLPLPYSPLLPVI
jgi:hypothetical protein